MLQSALHEPHSILRQAVYLMCASTLHQLCREWIKAHQYAAALIALATEHTLPMLLAQGTILQGRALVGLNSDADPLSHIQQGLQDYHATGAVAWRPMYLSMLASASQQLGQARNGLQQVNEALGIIERTHEHWWESELYRLRALLILDLSPKDWAEAQTWLQRALDTSRSQGTKLCELRATTDLARLWQAQGNPQEARELLAPVYSWFTEGFDLAALHEAQTVLDMLE